MTLSETKLSPMMLQWEQCKQQAQDAVLFFRLGDFYEAFYEDACIIARELDLTLTKRQDVPMAGVPFHASEAYIDRLIEKGYRVAIAEQMEDPRATKGLVKREVVRIVTPGTVIQSSLLAEKRNNFLGCLGQIGSTFGLALLDLTTADFQVMEFGDLKALLDALCRLRPRELLASRKWQDKHAPFLEEVCAQISPSLHFKEEWCFDPQHSCDLLCRHFTVKTLDGFGLKGMTAAINAAGALLAYVSEDLNICISHIKEVRPEHQGHYMLLDVTTQKNLELVEPLHEKKASLLHLLDRTATPMGGRLLRRWLVHPLLSVSEIGDRQEGVLALFGSDALYPLLAEVRDLERVMMRIETGYATPRDLVSLRLSLEQIPKIHALLEGTPSPLIQKSLLDCIDVHPITHKIQCALIDTPPLRLTDGGAFRKGYHEALDALKTLKENSEQWMAGYQVRLREETGIKSLKVGFTRAFGFYIEVSRGQAEKIPDHFQRRQTLVNAERFLTAELKEYEYKMLHAEEQIAALEAFLFTSLREEIAKEAQSVRKIAHAIACIDCLASLAKVARENNYIRPEIDESTLFHVEAGRHPVIESTLPDASFVPNDLFLDTEQHKLLLITGPNMAGKSTFIRQAALIAILAQMGSFVPARRARIGIIDKVFSRIGASDDLARGQSTFMVEMTETANILHNATCRSLVILDEIGRGTSTYDGISIAWAVAEYLLTHPKRSAKTLFATHYWELTALEQKIPGAVNFHVAVHESKEGIVFLRKIVRGGTDKSYGIHVAKLAGLPAEVLRSAEQMLAKLEKSKFRSPTPHKPEGQLSFLP